MRVTDAYIHHAMLQRVQQGNSRVASASVALASGRRIQTAADDPVAAAALRRVDGNQRAVADGLARGSLVTGPLEVAESALGEGSNVLVRAYELALQASNDSYGAEGRSAAASEIRQIREMLLSIANTEFDGRFLFAGLAEDTRPFDDTGVYQGDTGAREVELARGLRVQATLTGDGPFAGANGGVDLFATLDQLATALDAGDGDTAATLAQAVDVGRDQLTAARAELGARLNLVSQATAFGERLRESLDAQRRDLVDTDVARTATDLSVAENTLQAAVSVTKRIMEPSVLRMLM